MFFNSRFIYDIYMSSTMIYFYKTTMVAPNGAPTLSWPQAIQMNSSAYVHLQSFRGENATLKIQTSNASWQLIINWWSNWLLFFSNATFFRQWRGQCECLTMHCKYWRTWISMDSSPHGDSIRFFNRIEFFPVRQFQLTVGNSSIWSKNLIFLVMEVDFGGSHQNVPEQLTSFGSWGSIKIHDRQYLQRIVWHSHCPRHWRKNDAFENNSNQLDLRLKSPCRNQIFHV